MIALLTVPNSESVFGFVLFIIIISHHAEISGFTSDCYIQYQLTSLVFNYLGITYSTF